jgi:hypothetical protein
MNVRCYDNGGITADRYTIVFLTPCWVEPENGQEWYVVLACEPNPFNENGIGAYHNEYPRLIDEPSSGHLGFPIQFDELPPKVRKLVEGDLENLADCSRSSTGRGCALH